MTEIQKRLMQLFTALRAMDDFFEVEPCENMPNYVNVEYGTLLVGIANGYIECICNRLPTGFLYDELVELEDTFIVRHKINTEGSIADIVLENGDYFAQILMDVAFYD